MSQRSEVFGSAEVSDPAGDKLPPFVTFTSGAALLMAKGLVESITPDGLRYIARTADDWPFGNGEGRLPYVLAGRTRTMETGKFLSYFRQGPPRGGRGVNPKPKKA
ncbi:class II aldolase/adducin head domain-containing protein [Streptomyces caniscabiei]|uniref:hypothetical protein n=1 Tax=Streptomyces caniscabiei TaxID=2746961 RepID=UPI0029B70C65|nr:hypothetical protein [Streptomyces caniscabiei]MDX2986525.1 hypothetical protein [Streptomyces caniscabiei]